jgi:hypothetical protein
MLPWVVLILSNELSTLASLVARTVGICHVAQLAIFFFFSFSFKQYWGFNSRLHAY